MQHNPRKFARHSKQNKQKIPLTRKTRKLFHHLVLTFLVWKDLFKRWRYSIKPSTLTFFHDLFMMGIASLTTLALLRGEDLTLISPFLIARYTIVYVLIAAAVFIWIAPYRHVWKYASFNDVIRIVLSIIYVNVIFLPLQVKLLALPAYSLSISTLTIIMSFTLISLPRLFYLMATKRTWKDWLAWTKGRTGFRTIIIGATDQAEIFIRHTRNHERKLYNIVGIIDDNHHKISQMIHGISVIGHFNDLPKILAHHQKIHKPIEIIIIADLSLYGPAVRPIAQIVEGYDVEVLRLADFSEMTKPIGSSAKHKNHWATMINLPQITDNIDKTLIRNTLMGKRVLITGAQGPISLNLVKELANFGPAHITLVANDDLALSRIEKFLIQHHPLLSRKFILSDCRTKTVTKEILDNERPDFIIICPFSQAPAMAEFNPAAVVETTLIPFLNILDVLEKHHLQNLIFISNTFAINAQSVLGQTYKLMEMIFTIYAQKNLFQKTNTKIFRLPSLIDDPDSILNVVQKSLTNQHVIFLPHSDMTRFYIPDEQAAFFILTLLADLEPDLFIYVPHITNPVAITNAVYRIIQESGLKPDFDINIEFSNQMMGEPLHEQLLDKNEKALSSSFQGLLKAQPLTSNPDKLMKAVQSLLAATKNRDDFEVQKRLAQLNS